MNKIRMNNMVKMIFDEEQERLTVSSTGQILLLTNSRKIETPIEPCVSADEVTSSTLTTMMQWEYDGVWLYTGGLTTEAALTAAAQKMVLEKITDWDTSSAVNGFILNGERVWLDKATRVGLMNSTSIAKAMGQATTTLWLGDAKLVVECDKAIQLLSALEMYALECFNVTAAHKKAVSEMSTVEEVLAYDYTAGYPKILEMSV
ncbi:DUF4376 domain-containing protein [uncultured Prevotella sp.]|uniref:DUF4376 domain-containing protein n=1 Tax=uncultured Prevotella sp. TaxID=159272 RepID=UPI002639C9B5|nr:DUF4376 domain-containing protein [uncultured Prevotella sp.]